MTPQTERLRYAFQKVDLGKLKDTSRQSNWNYSQDSLGALQEALVKGLSLHCPRSRPSQQARAEWSPNASRLVKDTRQTRRQALQTGDALDNFRFKKLRKELKKEVRRVQSSELRMEKVFGECDR